MTAIHSGDTPTFVITVSSRALFDLEESHEIFETQGEEAFAAYMRERENEPLSPGPAMPLVCKLLALNEKLPDGVVPFEVILLSRNSSETCLRVFNAIEKLKLPITRAVFTDGAPTSNYIEALGTKLFLSSNPKEVAKVIKAGVAAATLAPMKNRRAVTQRAGQEHDQIRIAFDGDAVLFGDEAERAHSVGGLEGFHRHERERAHEPLTSGPFRPILEAIHTIQQAFPRGKDCPVRTALVTARGAPAHKRTITTLREWGIRVDESMFLGGRPKGPFLKAFGADLFFDDSRHNIEHANSHDIPSGHVPFGVRNQEGADETKFTGGAAAVAVVPVPSGKAPLSAQDVAATAHDATSEPSPPSRAKLRR